MGRRGDFAGKGRECIREKIMGSRKVKMGDERKRGKRKDATRGRTQRRKRKGNGIMANANTGRKDDDEKRVG